MNNTKKNNKSGKKEIRLPNRNEKKTVSTVRKISITLKVNLKKGYEVSNFESE